MLGRRGCAILGQGQRWPWSGNLPVSAASTERSRRSSRARRRWRRRTWSSRGWPTIPAAWPRGPCMRPRPRCGRSSKALGSGPVRSRTRSATSCCSCRAAAARGGAARGGRRPAAAGVRHASSRSARSSSSAAAASFDERERRFARAAADEIALARRAFGNGDGTARVAPDLLGLAGDALAAGSDEARAAEQVATLAAEATGARACLVWRYEPQGPVLAALSGSALPRWRSRPCSRPRARRRSLAMERVELPDELVATLVTLPLGQPPRVPSSCSWTSEPADGEPAARPARHVRRPRGACAARRGAQADARARARAHARAAVGRRPGDRAALALAHARDRGRARRRAARRGTAGRLPRATSGRRLEPAAARELAGPHARVAERLLELALGPAPRPRPARRARTRPRDPRLAGVRDALEEVGIEAALAVPLRRPRRGDRPARRLPAARPRADRERAARCSRRSRPSSRSPCRTRGCTRRRSELGAEREQALDAERVAARRLRALYEISRSFAQSLSLEPTLDAVARDDRRAARGRRGGDPHAGRARRARSSRTRSTCASARLDRGDAGDPRRARSRSRRAPPAASSATGSRSLLDARTGGRARPRRTRCSSRSSSRARPRR